MDEKYFEWLVAQVTSPSLKNPSRTYFLLLEQLLGIEFEWFVPNDDNRALDGLMLRDEFCDEIGNLPEHAVPAMLHSPCSFLEMLIGIAKRANFETDGPLTTGVSEWFWELLSNAGLSVFTDNVYMSDDSTSDKVAEVVDVILSRTYDYNGEGGLFPLEGHPENQRIVELWYQLSAYINQTRSELVN